MIEYIANATAATFVSVAQANGIHIGGKLIQNGYLTKGGWFLNYVGKVYQPTGATTTDPFGNTVPVMAALPGVWIRLRINGPTPAWVTNFGADLKAAGGTVYTLRNINNAFVWSDDGTTAAPDYVGTVGLIA